MCVTVEVTLPTIQTFLLLFSLRVGCLIVLFWTSFRSCFGVLFFTSAILEVLVRRKSPLGAWLVSPIKKNSLDANVYVLYYLYVTLLVVEAVLLLFTVVHLAWGLYWEKSRPLKQYIICRFLTWIVEVVVLLFLCINHKLLIGWYLVLLLFVILEFYSLIAVYSYYVNVSCEEISPQNYPEKLQKMYNFYPNPVCVFLDMAYELPRMTRCCCCFSLRTGSLIIGYVSILTSALFMAAVSWSLYKVVTFVNANDGKPNPEHTPEDMAQIALGVYISHAYFLLVLLYYFVISLLLVIGVHMAKTKYMRYYFMAGLFLLALALALVVVTTIFFGLLATIPLLKWSLTLFYCLIIVRSAYLEMEEQNKPRVYEMRTLYQAPLIA